MNGLFLARLRAARLPMPWWQKVAAGIECHVRHFAWKTRTRS